MLFSLLLLRQSCGSYARTLFLAFLQASCNSNQKLVSIFLFTRHFLLSSFTTFLFPLVKVTELAPTGCYNGYTRRTSSSPCFPTLFPYLEHAFTRKKTSLLRIHPLPMHIFIYLFVEPIPIYFPARTDPALNNYPIVSIRKETRLEEMSCQYTVCVIH